jgi:hypothetical protein
MARERLSATLRTDQDFDAFCLDFFRTVYQRFAAGMDRVGKTNLLLSIADEAGIVRCLELLASGGNRSTQLTTAPSQETATHVIPAGLPSSRQPSTSSVELTIEHVKAACARLTTADAQGSGYFVRPDLVVTCTHVVRSVGVGGFVAARFDGQTEPVLATVECIYDDQDFALLRLAAPLGDVSVLPRIAQAQPEARWVAFGYPSLTGDHGIALSGVVRAPCAKDASGNPVVQLFCDEAAAARGAVLGGASGAPVISGGHIIGHLRRVLPDEADRTQLGLVFACPAVAYESALPSLGAPTQFRARSPQADYDPLWYIPRRDAELLALNKLRDAGIPVTLQAPEGFGKSWMVRHLLERMAQQDLTTGQKTDVVRFNLRKATTTAPSSLDQILTSLLRGVLEQLHVERVDVLLARASKVPGDAKRKFRRAFEQQVLSCAADRVLLILEEADHLHGSADETDFFAVLRAMAEDTTALYQRLRLLVTIGAEAGFLETTNHSAFFGLSLPIVLDGFTLAQLRAETSLYGLHPDDSGLRELHRLTGGHPFFARLAMHEAVCGEKSLAEVLSATDARGGLFASSLQRLRMYVEREGLKSALCEILASPRYNLPAIQYLKLYRRGLVIETNPGEYRLRCPLFEDYFRALCR